MLGIVLILLFCLYLSFVFPLKRKKKEERKDPKFESQIKKLWSIAQSSMRERKPIRAEKALLTILKFDEKNAAAYNRLGILYAKDQRYEDAIECFEIAQSLDNNASSLHNVGLIYLETGAYEKAAMAFRQALELEGDIPARFIALAKSEEKLGKRKAALEALEAAYDLDHSTATLRQILAIYEAAEDTENIAATTARIEARLAENAERKAKATARARRKTFPRITRAARPAIRRAATKSRPRAASNPARAAKLAARSRRSASTRSTTSTSRKKTF